MFKVGLAEGLSQDEQRRNWSGDAPRPVNWTAWYPAADDAREEMRFLGLAERPLFIMGKIAPNASLNDALGAWPVVLLSHGTGGTAAGLSWLGRRLAARGFAVLAVNHHGNTGIEPYRPEGFLCWWERARDLSFILDHLAIEGLFAARLDLSRTFAAGFSLGGYTVLALAGAITDLSLFEEWLRGQGKPRGPREFPDIGGYIPNLLATSPEFRASQARHSLSYRDPRIRAILALAPAPPVRSFSIESLRSIELPVGIMVGPADIEAPVQECAAWLAEHIPTSELTLLEPDAGHYVFLCEATDPGRKAEPAICLDPAGVDRSSIHDRAAEAATRLFQSSH